jgi:hypothetical protein
MTGNMDYIDERKKEGAVASNYVPSRKAKGLRNTKGNK